MSTAFSQIPNNSVFNAGGASYRKLDALYYEDLSTGFQSVWTPMFDATIVIPEPLSEDYFDTSKINTTDEFLVDSQTRIMKLNPNYQKHSAAEKAFAELWGSGEFDCGPEDYQEMVKVSLEAISKNRKAL